VVEDGKVKAERSCAKRLVGPTADGATTRGRLLGRLKLLGLLGQTDPTMLQ
jgi:hypothetical protein